MKIRFIILGIILINSFLGYTQCHDVLFIIDDSASIDETERSEMQSSIQQLSDIIYSIDPNSRIGIVQYGQNAPGNYNVGNGYYMSLALTSNPIITLTNNPGGNILKEDVLPYSIKRMTDDGLFNSGGEFENISSIFIFTDAHLDNACQTTLTNCSNCTVPGVSCGFDYLSDLSNMLGNIPISVFRVIEFFSLNESAIGIAQNGGILIEQDNFSITPTQIDNIIISLDCIKATFRAEKTCIGDFTEFYVNIPTPITSITWDFGDGSSSSDENPTHNYLSTGTYDVNVVLDSDNEMISNSFSVTIDDRYIAYQPNNLISCDDEINDGIATFNLNEQNNQISNGQTGNFNISFHLTQQDADLNNNPISSPYTNTENFSQIIFTRIENSLNTNCYDTNYFFIETIEAPLINMEDTWYICPDEELTILAEPGFDEYIWSTGETSQQITVTQPGNYSVTLVRNINSTPTITRCETIKSLIVLNSEKATIENIEISDLSDNNTITIIVTGIGDYEYSINGVTYQDHNVFNNVPPGFYSVYVNDKNGCGIVKDDIYVLSYPKFFSPNSDGINDFWQIHTSNMEHDLKVSIYDRYGKLLKRLSATEKGWDGKFNGLDLPSNDYWFSIIRPKNGREYRGHFSLKR